MRKVKTRLTGGPRVYTSLITLAGDATASSRTPWVTLCASMRTDLGLALLLLLSAVVESNSTSPPGKPVLLSCRSPEKETFTCWWEPGSSGGLPTTHRLYYERERLEGVHECPDYRSAGRNSCFFDKNHTSIWVEYYLTVVASNALGNATSDPFKMDVMDIVKPNAPENLTLQVEEREGSPYLHILWQRPVNTDTKSGWVTIKYELRVKQENDVEWKEYMSGTQTYFHLYSVIPGVVHMVQVRCRLDHGSWSEWTSTTYVKVPSSLQRVKPFWILVSTLSAIPLITAVCVLITKRKYVKQWVLTPVPGPKIRGIDFQLLKSGRSEDVINALIINPNFHTVTWTDEMEECLIVTEDHNGLLPDPSNVQKSLIIPAGFHLEIQCKNSTPIHNECERAGQANDEIDNFVKRSLSAESLCDMETSHLPTQSRSNQEDAVKPLTDGSYVDIRTHVDNLQEVDVKQVDYSRVCDYNSDSALVLEKNNIPLNSSGYTDVQTQEEEISEDYSRVKVDGDYKVFLLKQEVSGLSSCREKGNHHRDGALQKPHLTGAFRVGMCSEHDGGYVDNTSELPSCEVFFSMQLPNTNDTCP